MASDWIKMRPELLREPEVIGIARRLSVSREHVVGCLLCVWGVADAHAVSRPCPDDNGTTEGHLSRYCPADIDREAGLAGFAVAMIDVGWLVEHEDGVSFPEWDVHNSRSAKTRACEQKKKARQRGNVPVASRSCPDDTGTKPGTREEKRREEVLEEKEADAEPPKKDQNKAKARELARSFNMPPGCDTPEHRGAMAHWLLSRYHKHGTWYHETAWAPFMMVRRHWTPEQWMLALTEAAAQSNEHPAQWAVDKASKQGTTTAPPKSKTKELTAP